MQDSAVDVGWFNSSRWIPYVLLGLLAGVFVDRISRKRVLILTDVGRGVLLAVIYILVVFG